MQEERGGDSRILAAPGPPDRRQLAHGGLRPASAALRLAIEGLLLITGRPEPVGRAEECFLRWRDLLEPEQVRIPRELDKCLGIAPAPLPHREGDNKSRFIVTRPRRTCAASGPRASPPPLRLECGLGGPPDRSVEELASRPEPNRGVRIVQERDDHRHRLRRLARNSPSWSSGKRDRPPGLPTSLRPWPPSPSVSPPWLVPRSPERCPQPLCMISRLRRS